MSGESPLSMMRPRRRACASGRPGAPARLWLPVALVAIVIVLAVGLSWGWYLAASIADRALAGWVEREAKLGRVYACGSQSIGGFPFRIVTDCDKAAATFNSNHPPFDVTATDVTFLGRALSSDPVARRHHRPGHAGRSGPAADLRRQLVARAIGPARPAVGSRRAYPSASQRRVSIASPDPAAA